MKISKVVYLLFGGGILAIVAILIAFYQPNLIEEKEVVYYDRHAGNSVDYKGEKYQVIKIGDIVLVE